jgi:subtilisin family serine protease
VGFVDMEQGWTLNHEDLAAANITIISGVNKAYASHGTAVMGEVVAVDNALGNIGIAPHCTARVVSQWRTSTQHNTAEAILSAIDNMSPGDVLLLEAQTSYAGYGTNYLPVEVYQVNFDAIAAATATGIVVVEAAGSSNDLDAFLDFANKQVLNRASADFRDSGAIMVGAASSTHPHSRLEFSNYGSRIDCYGWGRNVDTCGGSGAGITDYTTNFGGTSSASPIVAGAAILLQSWRRSFTGALNPAEMRSVLSSTALNTASSNPSSDRIGVMPDLKSIIRSYEKPFDPNRWLAIIYILFGVVEGGGGIGWRPGGPPIPIDPRGPLFDHLAPEKRDILVALAMTELAGLVEDGDARTSMNKAALSAMQGAVEKLGRQI